VPVSLLIVRFGENDRQVLPLGHNVELFGRTIGSAHVVSLCQLSDNSPFYSRLTLRIAMKATSSLEDTAPRWVSAGSAARQWPNHQRLPNKEKICRRRPK
jgi:hypothetical protein